MAKHLQRRRIMVDIIYDEESFKAEAPEERVENLLSSFEKELDVEGTYSLSFVSPETIRNLNREYREKDEVTDILTFRLDDGESFPGLPEEEKELGDIFICLERMKENAAEFGSSDAEELARLCLHGLMHLVGYDHKTNDFSTEEMLILQEKILSKYI